METLPPVRRLRNGKSPGPDGLHAEVLKSLDCVNLRVLHEHITRVWIGADDMPEDWVNNYLIPSPEQGDLNYCKEWRGILVAAVPGRCLANYLMHGCIDMRKSTVCFRKHRQDFGLDRAARI